MDYTVRPMERDDWGEVVELYYQGIQTNNATFEIDCPSYEAWDEAHAKSCRFVAEADAEVVGWIAVSPLSDREYLRGVVAVNVYVDAGHQRRGVGERLTRALLEATEREGFWTVEASVLQSNAACLGLFEKCGFRTVGYRERLAKDRFGMWRNVVVLEHRITKDIAGGCDCEMVRAMQRENASCCG